MTKKETIIVLFSITLCWSSSYIFIKDLSSSFSAYAYLTLTSGIAGIGLAIAFRNLFKKLDKKTLFYGSILAFLIAGNIIFEKMALDRLPASAVSAIAAMNIVIVPLILICRRRFPSRNNIAGIAIIILGLAISGHLHMQGGDISGIIYNLLSCLMMSLYTVFAADYTKEADPLLLTVLQLCVTAVIGLLFWVVRDPGSFKTINWSLETFSYIVIIAFFSKAYAYVMLMYSEKYCDAITVTIIAATDPIVTLVLAVLIPSTLGATELFSTRSLLGAIIIAVGAIVAGTSFLSAKKAKTNGTQDASSDDMGDTALTAAEADAAVKSSTVAAAAAADAGVESGSVTAASADAGVESNAVTADVSNPGEKSSAVMAAAADAGEDSVAVEQPDDTIYTNKWMLLRVFIALTVAFALLGMSINVMKYADGYTEIRPENFIPVTAGILFGPVAAIACAIGNFLQDRMFDFGYTSILGFFANFLAAYLPYKLWRAAAGNTINAHTVKRLLLYIWTALISSLATAAFLSYGLEIFFGSWYATIGRGIFYNNFIFSIMFGLPSFIVLTSDDSHMGRISAGFHPTCGLKFLECLQPYTLILYAIETVLLTINIVTFRYGTEWSHSFFRRIQWLVAFIILILLCLIPTKTQENRKTGNKK